MTTQLEERAVPLLPLRVELSAYGEFRGLALRDAADRYVAGLTFRDVMALVAARHGMIRMRWRRRNSPWVSHHWLEADTDVYGIAYGTLSKLQTHQPPHHYALLSTPAEEGPCPLTPLGELALHLVESLDGVALPTLDHHQTTTGGASL